MGTPRIFVSYSARKNAADETPDKDRAAALVEMLREDGFDPWWDQDGLELNNIWNDTISDALATCHGAVVLLSPVSIDSDFVRHEAGYLSIRRRTEPDFPLCSFLCDGLEETGLTPFFKAIRFSDFQFKPWQMADRRRALNEALGVAQDVAEIPEEPVAALESTLGGRSYFGSIEANDLRAAARRLHWDEESHWRIDAAVPRLFVRHLLSIPIYNQFNALLELGRLLTVEQVREVFESIVPFWIDERAAGQFARLVEAAPGQRGMVINAHMATFTPEMFARRYRPHRRWNPQRFRILSHTASGRDGGVIAQARHSILQRLGLDDSATEDLIDQELKRLPSGKKLCSVICDADEEDLKDLATLQNDFKEVMFVALTGDHLIEIPAQSAGRCEVVDPPLCYEISESHHNEANAHASYRECLDDLES
ncbi:MAG: toll/interleukin-1 receptor domain-containing protein [Gammaproteobacteria bacterium]|nr:toll/interleukin-1 receptor domain-containing protein [Gammaproteobacteria bacterium]